jgi:hypothetical protein
MPSVRGTFAPWTGPHAKAILFNILNILVFHAVMMPLGIFPGLILTCVLILGRAADEGTLRPAARPLTSWAIEGGSNVSVRPSR